MTTNISATIAYNVKKINSLEKCVIFLTQRNEIVTKGLAEAYKTNAQQNKILTKLSNKFDNTDYEIDILKNNLRKLALKIEKIEHAVIHPTISTVIKNSFRNPVGEISTINKTMIELRRAINHVPEKKAIEKDGINKKIIEVPARRCIIL